MLVDFVLAVTALHEVAEDDPFGVEDLLSTLAELSETLFEHVLDLSPVVFGGKSIMKDTHIFVVP